MLLNQFNVMTDSIMNYVEAYSKSIDIFPVAPKISGLKDLLVNTYLIESEDSKGWVLIDAGLKTSANKIREFVKKVMPPLRLPNAIILTHGHFDHVGSLLELANEWDVPIYAHKLEKPYLTGKSKYPPADSTVGGGLLTTASFLFPIGPINVGDRLLILPDDGSVPILSGWKYIHTPGHSPGHISLFREADKVLVVGDAFVTTQQESLVSVILQTKKVCGPPRYFTPNWQAAEMSVRKLAALRPNIAAAGHGKPMQGIVLNKWLQDLADNFKQKAVPHTGRYVDTPAITNEDGVVYLPPVTKKGEVIATAVGIISASLVLWSLYRKAKGNIPVLK